MGKIKQGDVVDSEEWGQKDQSRVGLWGSGQNLLMQQEQVLLRPCAKNEFGLYKEQNKHGSMASMGDSSVMWGQGG